jgi:hypothetical protein
VNGLHVLFGHGRRAPSSAAHREDAGTRHNNTNGFFFPKHFDSSRALRVVWCLLLIVVVARSMRRDAHVALAARPPTALSSFSLVVTCVSVARVLLASTWAQPLPLVDGITQINDHVSPSLCKDCSLSLSERLLRRAAHLLSGVVRKHQLFQFNVKCATSRPPRSTRCRAAGGAPHADKTICQDLSLLRR